MVEAARGLNARATGKRLVLAIAMLASLSGFALGDDGMLDVRTLPRVAGAFDSGKPTEAGSLSYGVPTPQAVTIEAVRKLLSSEGWIGYVEPLEETSTTLLFKKGGQGLYVSLTQGLGRPDQSAVDYTSNRINANLPFPQDAAGVVFDSNRPYLSCSTAATVDATLAFFQKELLVAGWSPLAAATIAERWPDADLNQTIDNGARAFFGREGNNRQAPIMVSLRRRADGRTGVDVRVATFALPKDLKSGPDVAGLPRPERTKSAQGTGGADSNRRELKAAVMAEIPAVAAFYRAELAARGWKQEGGGTPAAPDQVVMNFSSAEETAILTLVPKYDFTTVTFTVRVKDAALAARAKAKKEADEKFMTDAEETARQVMAADAVRRAAQAANLSDAPLRARADNTSPVPLPETADNVQFKEDGDGLEFDSSSSVKALAAFYRGALKAQGWRETPSVINNPNMAVLEFSKAGKNLSFTMMQMGPKVNVTGDGSGFAIAKAKPDTGARQTLNDPGAPASIENLEADPDFESAGSEAAHHEFARYRQASRQRDSLPQGTRRQRAGRSRLRARVLSWRARQARLEGIGRPHGRQTRRGPTGVLSCRRAGDPQTRS